MSSILTTVVLLSSRTIKHSVNTDPDFKIMFALIATRVV
jgi:hypothetical protein